MTREELTVKERRFAIHVQSEGGPHTARCYLVLDGNKLDVLRRMDNTPIELTMSAEPDALRRARDYLDSSIVAIPCDQCKTNVVVQCEPTNTLGQKPIALAPACPVCEQPMYGHFPGEVIRVIG